MVPGLIRRWWSHSQGQLFWHLLASLPVSVSLTTGLSTGPLLFILRISLTASVSSLESAHSALMSPLVFFHLHLHHQLLLLNSLPDSARWELNVVKQLLQNPTNVLCLKLFNDLSLFPLLSLNIYNFWPLRYSLPVACSWLLPYFLLLFPSASCKCLSAPSDFLLLPPLLWTCQAMSALRICKSRFSSSLNLHPKWLLIIKSHKECLNHRFPCIYKELLCPVRQENDKERKKMQ